MVSRRLYALLVLFGLVFFSQHSFSQHSFSAPLGQKSLSAPLGQNSPPAQAEHNTQENIPSLFSVVDQAPAQQVGKASNSKKRSGRASRRHQRRSRQMRARTELLQERDTILLNLFDDVSVEVSLRATKGKKQGATVWRGRIIGKWVNGQRQQAHGKATLVIKNNTIVGNVRMDGQLFEIAPNVNTLNGSGGNPAVHTIKEIEAGSFPEDHPFDWQSDSSIFADPATASSSAVLSPLAVSGQQEIRVLVLYTQAVNNNVADIDALVALAMDETNQSFLDRGLTAAPEFVLTSAQPVDYVETDYSQMLTSLSGTSDGVLDAVHDLRYREEADVVVLLSSQNDYCGIGYLNASYARAFAVVNYLCATGNFSFAHELGHLAGARHNISADSSTTPFAYGHGYQSPSLGFRTVMAYNCDAGNCPRIDYWSNPAEIHNGEVMGEVGISNNARVWEENATRLGTLHESYTPVDNSHQLWFYNINDRVYGSPVVGADNTVYFAGFAGNIFALNPDMSVKWQRNVGQVISMSLVLANGAVYYRGNTTGNREFGALNAADGQPLWTKPISGFGNAPAVATDGTLYIGNGVLLQAFDPQGVNLFNRSINSAIYATPAIAEDGTVHFATLDGRIMAVSSSGTTLWTVQLPESYVRTAMAIGLDGTLYAPTISGELYAFNPDGSEQWSYTFDVGGGAFTRSPVIDLHHNVIIGGAGNRLIAISPQGELAWQSFPLDSPVNSTAAIADNGDILVGTSFRLNALGADGRFLWSSSVNFINNTSPVIADNGIAYIGDSNVSNGGLRAFDVAGLKLADTSWPRLHGNAEGSSRFQRPSNHAPKLSIAMPVNGATFQVADGAIALQASAYDFEEGDLSAQISWLSDVDGVLNSPVALSVGSHLLTASVSDSGGLSDNEVVLVTIEQSQQVNQLPSVTLLSPANGDLISEDDNPIAFSYSASDPEDGDLSASVSLSSSIDGAISSPAHLSVGQHQITVQVIDSAGASAVDIISLEVTAHINVAPELQILSPSDGSVIVEIDNPVSFVLSATDLEDGDISANVQLSSSIDGLISNSAILSVGNHTISASVSDSDGAVSEQQISLQILPHQAPTLTQDFDLGIPTENWSFYASDSAVGRTQVVDGRLRMDVTTNNIYALNEAVFDVDLRNARSAVLRFWQSDHGDELEVMPETFSGHANADGVAISNDGVTWYRALDSSLLDVSTSGQSYAIDLNALIAEIQINYDGSFAYGDNFKIKFQQYDNYTYPSDGREWDDIRIDVTYSALTITPADKVSLLLSEEDIGQARCHNYQLHNDGSESLSWQAVTADSRLTLDVSSGELSAGQQDVVQACWSTAGLALGDTLNDVIVFSDSTAGGKTQRLEIELLVSMANPQPPFIQNFSNGMPPANAGHWSFYSSDSVGRIAAVDGLLRMDVVTNGTFSLNEAVLRLDLAGQSRVQLAFFQVEISDEIHAMPKSFTDHHNSDGVAISMDGVTWYQVVDASGLEVGNVGQSYNIDLDAELARIQSTYDPSFAYTSEFFIKFQQYDNYASPKDGREWNDISVTVVP